MIIDNKKHKKLEAANNVPLNSLGAQERLDEELQIR